MMVKHYGEIIVLLVYLLMFVIIARATGLDGRSRFINSLQDYTKYDKRLRPYHMDGILNVTVGITIFSFGEIDEIEGEFALDMFFLQTWLDPRLKHNNTAPIILSGTYTNLIWLPDTFFINIKTGRTHDVPSSTSDVKIMQNGEVRYSKRITMTAGCEIDLHRYPLDSQICKLRIMSYAYKSDEIDYQWKGDAKKDISVMNDRMAQLIVTKIQRQKTIAIFFGTEFSELVALFKFKRRLGYSLLQVYAPTFLIVTLSWLSFWISKNAVPARIALGVMTVLTIVTLNGSFRSTVPKVSYIKALDLYLIVSFFFVFGAVLEYILVLLHHDYGTLPKDKKEKQADEQEKLEESKDNSNQEVEYISSETVKSSSSSKLEAVEFIRNIISVNSTPIDKISKIAFPLSYIMFNIIYWIIYGI